MRRKRGRLPRQPDLVTDRPWADPDPRNLPHRGERESVATGLDRQGTGIAQNVAVNQQAAGRDGNRLQRRRKNHKIGRRTGLRERGGGVFPAEHDPAPAVQREFPRTFGAGEARARRRNLLQGQIAIVFKPALCREPGPACARKRAPVVAQQTRQRPVRTDQHHRTFDSDPQPKSRHQRDNGGKPGLLEVQFRDRPQQTNGVGMLRLVKQARHTGALDNACAKLSALFVLLESQAERSEGLENCRSRAQAIAQTIARWRNYDGAKDDGFVRWIELFGHSLQLHATPLSIAEIFRKQVTETSRAWVFTSATLSVNGDFKHYCGELGLEDAQTASWAKSARGFAGPWRPAKNAFAL